MLSSLVTNREFLKRTKRLQQNCSSFFVRIWSFLHFLIIVFKRTITINVPNDDPQTVVQTVVAKREKDTDLVTGEVTYKAWVADELPNYTAPEVPGYVASPAEIGSMSVIDENGNLIQNQTAVINYQKGTVTQIVHYEDIDGHDLIDPKDDAGQAIKDSNITGTIETKQNVPIPTGWILVDNTNTAITLPIPDKNGEVPILSIKIKHAIDVVAHDHYVVADSLINPAKPNGARNGSGMDQADLNQLAIRKIHVVFPNGYQPNDDFLHQVGIRQNNENSFTITQTVGYMRDGLRDRITGKLVGYRYTSGENTTDIMLDSAAYKTNQGWMLNVANSALGTYTDKNGVAFFKQVNLPKISGYSWHIAKKQTVDNLNNVPHMLTQYLVIFAASPAPKHNSHVGKSDTGLVEQSVKPINTQNKPAIEKQEKPSVLENTLLNNRHNSTSPAITYHVSDEKANPIIAYYVGDKVATNDPVNSWQVHNASAAQQNAAHHFGSNKAVNSVKRTNKHIIENSEVTKTSKISKTAKLNSNKVNAKTNILTQPKLKKVQESINRANRSELKHDALPQTGEKHNSLMAMLGLVISSLGLIGAMKSKKRKDD